MPHSNINRNAMDYNSIYMNQNLVDKNISP